MAVVLSFPWVYFFCSVGYTVFFLFVPPSLPENGGQGLVLALRVFFPFAFVYIYFSFFLPIGQPSTSHGDGSKKILGDYLYYTGCPLLLSVYRRWRDENDSSGI